MTAGQPGRIEALRKPIKHTNTKIIMNIITQAGNKYASVHKRHEVDRF